MDIAVIVGAMVLGALGGALLPRPAYRLSVPHDAAPAFRCLRCQAALPAGIRGWMGGSRCPACASPFTASRWLYVTAGASTFTLVAATLPHRRPGELVLLAAWLVFAAAGTLLSAIDIHAKRLPTTIIVPAAAVVGVLIVAASVTSHQLSIARISGVAAATVGLAYMALALLAPASVGMGDVRLAALSGLLLGAHGWGTVLVGVVLPYLLAAAAVTVLQLTGRRVHRPTEIPFGPCLVIGAVLAPSVHAAAV